MRIDCWDMNIPECQPSCDVFFSKILNDILTQNLNIFRRQILVLEINKLREILDVLCRKTNIVYFFFSIYKLDRELFDFLK